MKLPQLKTYEAEALQLRGLTIEQQRALRVTTRQTEQLQVSERMLKEEVTRLRGQLDKEKSHAICMQVGFWHVEGSENKFTDCVFWVLYFLPE